MILSTICKTLASRARRQRYAAAAECVKQNHHILLINAVAIDDLKKPRKPRLAEVRH